MVGCPLPGALLALAVVAGCTSSTARDGATHSAAAGATTSSAGHAAASFRPPAAPPAPPPPAVSSGAQIRPSGPLATFYTALHDLEKGRRADHVRILWLGDSHAQADFWPDAIRKGLQRRFGNGGPGFFHLGMRAYRHADLRFDLGGKWRMRPKAPSTIKPWGDGKFGLGGILHAGFAGVRVARARLEDPSLRDTPLRWDVCYKYGLENDRFRLLWTTGQGEPVERTFAAEGREALGSLVHVQHQTQGPAELKLRVDDGRPDFCGVVVETDPTSSRPGVVLDNLGINGARYATPLAWNEASWQAELRRRPAPELAIFEYGGNEASDTVVQPERYAKNAAALVGRVRAVRPDVSCLIIGPSDREDAEARIPPIALGLEKRARELGCRFFNTYEVMGGRGSLRQWRLSGRGAEDGIHLKPKGYKELGATLLGFLMSDYRTAPRP